MAHAPGVTGRGRPFIVPVIATVLCVAGAALRIAAVAQNRSLWYDEAALALSVVSRSFVGLLAPLDYLQAAPPLFLWLERLAVVTFGANEYALRLVPLVAGILTPMVGWRVMRQILPPAPALLAVGLLAFAPLLVRFAAEAKPYAVDVLVTLVLIERALAVTRHGKLAGNPTLNEPREAPDAESLQAAAGRDWALLAVAGVVALLLSTPAVFVLAGAVAFLAVRAIAAHDGRAVRGTLVLAAGWGAVFLLLLATAFRAVAGESTPIGRFMHWYWAASFLTNEPPGITTKVLAWLWAALTGTYWADAAIPGSTTLLLAAAGIGLVALALTRGVAYAALVIVPVISLLAAAALRRYPIAERLILFASPLTALLLGASQIPMWRAGSPGVVRGISALLIAAVVLLAGDGTLRFLASDVGRQESRALVRAAARERTAGAPVWISGGAEPAWRFYTEGEDAGRRPTGAEAPAAAAAAAAAAQPGDSARPTADAVAESGGASIDASAFAPGRRTLAPDVAVGAWYGAIPERIVNVTDDTAAAAAPSRWSEGEARRVRALARPCASIFFTHIQPGEEPALLRSVVALGGRVTRTRRAAGAALHTACF